MKGLRTSSESGLTLVETAIAVAILVLLVTSALTTVLTTQRVFSQSEIVGQIRARAQNAMERMVALSSQAVTSDPAFSTLNPATGIGASGLRFRLIESVDSSGQLIYDESRVYIYGPDEGSWPSTA